MGFEYTKFRTTWRGNKVLDSSIVGNKSDFSAEMFILGQVLEKNLHKLIPGI